MNSTGRPVAVDWAIAKDRYEAKMCKIEADDTSNTEEVKLNGSVKQKNVSSLAAEKNILPKGKVKEEISEDSESGKKSHQECDYLLKLLFSFKKYMSNFKRIVCLICISLI